MHFINKIKGNNYSYSHYLDNITNIADRRLFTSLRLGCFKLKSHSFKTNNEDSLCSQCHEFKDNPNHVLLLCEDRNIYDI